MKKKNNKIVIREDNVVGKFTTIPHRIIKDKRLSTTSRLLLISILSDADTFDFSRTGQMNRLGISEYKLIHSIKELKKYGYMKTTNMFGQYLKYTISMFGNLNQQSNDGNEGNPNLVNNETVVLTKSADSIDYLSSEQWKEDNELFKAFVSKYDNYIDLEKLKEGYMNYQTRKELFELKSELLKGVESNKRKHYKFLEKYVNNGYAPKEMKPKILKEVRRLITDENEKPDYGTVDKIRKKISIQNRKNHIKRYGFDFETQQVDSYENPLD